MFVYMVGSKRSFSFGFDSFHIGLVDIASCCLLVDSRTVVVRVGSGRTIDGLSHMVVVSPVSAWNLGC